MNLIRSRDQYDYYAGHLDSGAEHTAYLSGELVDDFALPDDHFGKLRANMSAEAYEIFHLVFLLDAARLQAKQ